MLKELLEIFRGGSSPLVEVAEEFQRMIALTLQMADLVEPTVFAGGMSLQERKRVYDLDVEVNKLERVIRKRLVTHLTLQPSQVPYCLLLMTMTKDVERVGDYIKNVAEVADIGGSGPGSSLPSDGPLRAELIDLISVARRLHSEAGAVLRAQNRERAIELVQAGRAGGKRCDQLVKEIASSGLPSAEVASLVLLTRFYKRVGAHLVNILSSVVMPLHKVDFFDEAELGLDGKGSMT
jgi:phosphate transport system protein